MKDIRLAASFLSNGGGAMPMNSNGASWNMDFVTTTGNVIIDLLHNFHLECGARLHKLRVYETLTDPTGREVCGYLLVRGGVHAHAYALALEKITGVDIKKMLPTPNINLDKIPESQKYLDEGSGRARRRCLRSAWDPRGSGRTPNWRKNSGTEGTPSAFAPDYAPEEMLDRDQALQEVTLKPTTRGATTGKAVNVNAPRFREQDIPIAITTLIQVLVQAEQVFDGAGGLT